MIKNFGGKRNRFGYYPPGVHFENNYVFLETLLGEESPKARQLGEDAIVSLETGFESGGLFDTSYYSTGLLILKRTIENERRKEIAVLAEMKSQLGESFSLTMPNMENAEEVARFYESLSSVVESIWNKNNKINQILTQFHGGEYGKAERVTQRFHLLLKAELYRVYNDSIHSAFAQDELMADISKFMFNKGHSKVNSAIIRAVVRMLNTNAENNDVQKIFFEKLQAETAESQQLIDALIDIIKVPTGLHNTERDVSVEFEKRTREELEKKKRKRGKKFANTKTIFPIRKFHGKIVALGLGQEAMEIIKASLINIIATNSAFGSAGRKTDTMQSIGEIHVDLDGIMKDVYRKNPVFNRIIEDGKSPYEFALEMQKSYEEAQLKITNARDSFVIHTSSKDYLADSITKSGGFSAGAGMTLKSLKGFLDSIGFVDTSYLIFALNNLSTEALGNHNSQVLSNFLAQYVAMFTFDDGITIYNNDVQRNIPNVKAIHMYALSGQNIMLSSLLQNIYDNIKENFEQITGPNADLRSFVRVDITPAKGFRNQLDMLTAHEVFNVPRWQAISAYSMAKTKITMNFLKNFNDMVKATKL